MSTGSDFWSRRKKAVEAEAEIEKRHLEEAEAEAVQAELAEKTDEEILQEFGLPDPDMLAPGQDIAGFMNKAVPERLRKRAMRQLWRLNPVLANLDGLNDYDGDFTNAATDAPGVATAYRVGKGLLKHIEALEQEAAKKRADVGADDVDIPRNLSEIAGDAIEPENAAEIAARPEIMQDYADAAPASTTIVEDDAEYRDGTPLDTLTEEPVRPRRMRFKIESGSG